MTDTTSIRPAQATRQCTGADIRTAKNGATLRFGGGLYLLVSANGTKSWQAHYHVAGKHQAVILGRWPDVNVTEAKAKRDAIRATVRAGGDPALDRHEQKAARIEADAATVRTIGEAWQRRAKDARNWSDGFATMVAGRLAKHVYPVLGDRPIGRVTTHEVEALIGDLSDRFRAQAVHVRQHLQLLFDFAIRRDLVTVNPVRKIAEDLPKRVRGDEREIGRAAVTTIEAARRVLAAIEGSTANPFTKLAHRLIALTAVRKLEGIEAAWCEITDTADGMVWTIPASRMKGRRGLKREHVIPLAPQAADVIRAARALADAMGIVSAFVFPGTGKGRSVERSCLNELMARVLPAAGLAGLHTVHGWRSTFSTICNEADPGAYRVVDVMLAHRAFGAVEGRYNRASFVAERRKLACTWADQLLLDAPTAFVLAGVIEQDNDNVVQFREAA
jgi:integrase